MGDDMMTDREALRTYYLTQLEIITEGKKIDKEEIEKWFSEKENEIRTALAKLNLVS